jgi:rhodanese-related sulfurtransferase
MKSGADLIRETKSRIRQVNAAEAQQIHKRGGAVFLDVRDLQEVNLGKIPRAVHISRGNLETKVEALVPRDADVIIYCASGNRSALAAETMMQLGYKNVASLDTGFRGWAESGGDIDD